MAKKTIPVKTPLLDELTGYSASDEELARRIEKRNRKAKELEAKGDFAKSDALYLGIVRDEIKAGNYSEARCLALAQLCVASKRGSEDVCYQYVQQLIRACVEDKEYSSAKKYARGYREIEGKRAKMHQKREAYLDKLIEEIDVEQKEDEREASRLAAISNGDLSSILEGD